MHFFGLQTLSPLFFIVYVCSSPWDYLPEDCGVVKVNQTDTVETRIINGQQAKLGQFPWLVKLGERINTKLILFYCGGSLINRYFVLSAAHCEEDADVIRIGENYVDSDIDCDESGICAPPHQDIKPKRYIFEDFCTLSVRNDIMLIELEEPAEFNDFVQPVCLIRGTYPIEDLVGKNVIMAGWGRTNATDKTSASPKLLYASLKVIENDRCMKNFSHIKADNRMVFCVSDDTDEDQRMCNGDSGGSAVISREVDGIERNYLVGVVSFGLPGCGEPGAFTNVSHYLNNFLQYFNKS